MVSQIAFAGLGAMGYGMASHLLKSNFPIIGYDVYPPSMDRLVAQGARSAQTPRDAAKDVQFFLCMVANHTQATSLLFDPSDGAVQALPTDATILMCSTVAPAYIDEVRQNLVKLGRSDVRLIDCPVSGGAGRAADGTLSIFSSGDDAHLASVHPILECMSSKLYMVPGGLGGGSKTKMIHQIFAGVNIAMASEAMGLAALAQLNTRHAFEELANGEGGSWMFENRVPHMLDPSLPPYSAITIIAKDVAIITSTSRDARFPLPIVSTAEQLYMTSISAGWGKEDDCVLVRLYLPSGPPDLVSLLANGPPSLAQTHLVVEDIKDLMVGVHLAAMSEAMSFCEHLGIDSDLMFDVVSNAAGASSVFIKAFSAMRAAKWSVRGVADIEQIRSKLSNAVAKISDLRYPLYLSSAALQEMNRQLQ